MTRSTTTTGHGGEKVGPAQRVLKIVNTTMYQSRTWESEPGSACAKAIGAVGRSLSRREGHGLKVFVKTLSSPSPGKYTTGQPQESLHEAGRFPLILSTGATLERHMTTKTIVEDVKFRERERER